MGMLYSDPHAVYAIIFQFCSSEVIPEEEQAWDVLRYGRHVMHTT